MNSEKNQNDFQSYSTILRSCGTWRNFLGAGDLAELLQHGDRVQQHRQPSHMVEEDRHEGQRHDGVVGPGHVPETRKICDKKNFLGGNFGDF